MTAIFWCIYVLHKMHNLLGAAHLDTMFSKSRSLLSEAHIQKQN